ncbi:unnamed protein product [Caenorhabditis brenneri]
MITTVRIRITQMVVLTLNRNLKTVVVLPRFSRYGHRRGRILKLDELSGSGLIVTNCNLYYADEVDHRMDVAFFQSVTIVGPYF